jgi:hypothetical protein
MERSYFIKLNIDLYDVDIIKSMPKRQDYITLEISGEKLDTFVDSLASRLLSEFWPQIDDPQKLLEIKDRLKKNVSDSLVKKSGNR